MLCSVLTYSACVGEIKTIYDKLSHNVRVKEYFVINPLKIKTNLKFIFKVPVSTEQ